MQSNSENPISIHDLAKQIVALREKPLLVIYYPCDGEIGTGDHKVVYDHLIEHAVVPIKDLDVLVHSTGGECNESYLISKAIWECAEHTTSLVPYMAASGGTSISISAEKILLGACGILSPIDAYETDQKTQQTNNITVVRYEDTEDVYINQFIEFIATTKIRIDTACGYHTNVENTLLESLVSTVGVKEIAARERQRVLPATYASKLLSRMFPDDIQKRAHIASKLVNDFPAHEFAIDYDFATDIGLVVEKMPFALSQLTKQYVKALDDCYDNKDICQDGDPFVEYYPLQ